MHHSLAMSYTSQLHALFPLEAAIIYNLLTVSSDTPLTELCSLVDQAPNSSYIFVVDNDQLFGILTEQDVHRLIGLASDRQGVTVAEVISFQVITTVIRQDQLQDISTVLNLFRQHHLEYLPVVDATHQPVGLITLDRIRSVLDPMAIIQAISDRQQAEIALRNLYQESENRANQLAIALQESEERFQLAVDGVNDGIWDWNIKAEKIYLSPRCKSMLGYLEHELSSTNAAFHQIVHPDDLDKVTQTMQDYLQRIVPIYEVEFRALHKDGSYHWILGRGSALWDEHGEPYRMAGSHTDISDRKQVELILSLGENRLRTIVSNISDGIIILNEQGKIIFVNPSAEKMFDRQAHELHGLGIGIPIELNEPFELDIIRDNGSIGVGEMHVVQAEWDEEIAYIASLRDITERNQVAQALHESQQFAQRIADASPNILYIYDLQKKQNVYINHELYTSLGYTPQEFQAMDVPLCQTLIHPEDLERIYQHHQCLLKVLDNDALEIEYRIRHKTGEWRWFSSRDAIFTRSEDGSAKQIIGSAQDISDRKRMEKEQAQLYQQLQSELSDRKQAEEKLQEVNDQLLITNIELARATTLKDEFLANMSHELRTPLNAILGMSEGLLEEAFAPLTDRQKKAITIIARSGKHLLELINDILDLAKIESGKLELQTTTILAKHLCESSITFVRQLAHKKNIKLSTELSADVSKIEVDERRMRQVLINLLSNAVKFTPDGGRVTLKVKTDPINSVVSFSVIDTGIGIATADMGKLFQPFVQIDSSLNRRHDGTGLGLALVRRIVELHGGGISLESQVGEGSEFTVSIPWQQEIDNSCSLSLDIPYAKVLIIADPSVDTEELCHHFSELGIRTIAYNQIEGVVRGVLQTHPDLIVLHVRSFNRTYWDVLTYLQSDFRTRNIPLLMISTIDESESVRRALRSRFPAYHQFEYLVKPISVMQLQLALSRIYHIEPLATDKPFSLDQASTSRSDQPLILLAEDNEDNIETMADYLKMHDYQLVLAKNGIEAIKLAKSRSPKLILMDIQMPEMDGLEAIRQIRADPVLVKIPIIALTALAMPGDREKCLAAGANEYMLKPVSLRSLVESMHRHIFN